MSSSSQVAFLPLGPTVSFTTATPTAPTAVQAPVKATETSCGQFRVVNDGLVTVFLAIGATSAEAISNANAVATCVPILAGGVEVLRFPAGAFFTGVSASSTSAVYVTPGQGL
jgi:hypothetical protein